MYICLNTLFSNDNTRLYTNEAHLMNFIFPPLSSQGKIERVIKLLCKHLFVKQAMVYLPANQ